MTLKVICKLCGKHFDLSSQNIFSGFCWSCEIKLRVIKRKHQTNKPDKK